MPKGRASGSATLPTPRHRHRNRQRSRSARVRPRPAGTARRLRPCPSATGVRQQVAQAEVPERPPPLRARHRAPPERGPAAGASDVCWTIASASRSASAVGPTQRRPVTEASMPRKGPCFHVTNGLVLCKRIDSAASHYETIRLWNLLVTYTEPTLDFVFARSGRSDAARDPAPADEGRSVGRRTGPAFCHDPARRLETSACA